MKKFGVILVIVLALWVALRGNNTSTPDSSTVGDVSTPAAASASGSVGNAEAASGSATEARRLAIGFRSAQRLAEHYQKHGREFGDASEAEYLRMAQELRDAAVGGDVLEVVRPTDGVISRFDRTSGAFLAADADGIIRTFFKPNDGEAYFRRQAKRRPTP